MCIDLGPSQEQFIHVNASSMEISFCSRRIFIKVINMKFCIWHDNYTGVACVKCCRDMIPDERVTLRPISHRIWITMGNPLWNGPQVQHWFGERLGSWRPRAITWTIVGPSVVRIWHSLVSWVGTRYIIQQICFGLTQILSFYCSVKYCCNHASKLKSVICFWIQR